MAGYDGHRGYIYYLAVLPELQKKELVLLFYLSQKKSSIN